MGWSCRAEAAHVLDAWDTACRLQTATSNTFTSGGNKYFYERSNTEHGDDAITGVIYKYVDESRVRKSGTFRIEGDGTVTRAPAFLKSVKVKPYERRPLIRFEFV